MSDLTSLLTENSCISPKPKLVSQRYTSKFAAMRYIYFLLFAVLVTSCAHNRLRLVKVHKKDRTETVAQHESEKRRSYKKEKEREIVVVTEEEIATRTVLESQPEEVQPETKSATVTFDKIEEQEIVSEVEDEVENEPSKGRKLQEALAAEDVARKAKNSFIWAIVMLFTIFIPFVPLFSLIPFVVGSIQLWRSSRYDYITLEGEKHEKTARTIQIIYGVIFLLLILAILALFLL